jgi:hypothetical protein
MKTRIRALHFLKKYLNYKESEEEEEEDEDEDKD